MGNFDTIVEKIGPSGRYQITYWILCGLAIIPAGIQHMANVFLQATPPYWCNMPDSSNYGSSRKSNATATPGGLDANEGSCRINVNFSIAGNFSDELNLSRDNESYIECNQWIYDYSKYGVTAVTKWDLVCSSSWLVDASQSLYMMGVVLGAFLFGHISDISGRKPAICLSLSGVVFFGSLAGMVPGVWLHLVTRIVAGMCASGCITIAVVLATELFGVKRRALPGISEHIFFVIGYLTLAGVAHSAKDFQMTALIIGILPVVLLPYWCILPESPRWLLTKGKVSEAKKELSRAARMNGVTVNVDELVDECLEVDDNDTMKIEDGKKHMAPDLFRTPVVRKISLLILTSWFATECSFYGISLLYRELIVNIYLNSLVLGILELVVVFLVWLTIDRVGRRLLMAGLIVSAGVALVLSILLVDKYPVAHTILITTGRLCVVGSNAVHYAYTSELFPTVIRNIGFGSASTVGHIGAMSAPFINELRFAWRSLPCLVYGLLMVVTGFLGLLLPETARQPLPDTIEEAETSHRKRTDPSQSAGTGSQGSETHALLDAASPYPYPGITGK